MNNETNPGTVEVTQADREAAVDIHNVILHDWFTQHMLDGMEDECYVIQAFAKHRLAAQSQPAATVQEAIDFKYWLMDAARILRSNGTDTHASWVEKALAALSPSKAVEPAPEQGEELQAAVKQTAITAWNTRLASQPTSAEDAVAVIGKDWRLLWADQGPLSEIVGRTGIKIGSRLYATPDTQTAAIGAEDAAEKWLDGYSVPEHRNDQDYSSDQMVDAFMAGGREARGVALSFATGLDDADFANVAFALNQRMCCDGHMCGCQGATVGQYLAHELRASLSQPVAAPQAEDADANCDRCQGNGEIVTDWERYLHAHDGDVGDEAVTDCPDCDGTGHVELPTPPQPEGGTDRLVTALTKVMPIRVQNGPDYAEVYFSDGSTHSTQAMTMNPDDWTAINEAFAALQPEKTNGQ